MDSENEIKGAEVKEQPVLDAENSDVEETEQDDIEQVLVEMKNLIKMQPCSKASKFF